LHFPSFVDDFPLSQSQSQSQSHQRGVLCASSLEAITLEQVYVLARREITVGTDGECESKLGLVLSGLAGWLGIPKVFQMGEK